MDHQAIRFPWLPRLSDVPKVFHSAISNQAPASEEPRWWDAVNQATPVPLNLTMKPTALKELSRTALSGPEWVLRGVCSTRTSEGLHGREARAITSIPHIDKAGQIGFCGFRIALISTKASPKCSVRKKVFHYQHFDLWTLHVNSVAIGGLVYGVLAAPRMATIVLGALVLTMMLGLEKALSFFRKIRAHEVTMRAVHDESRAG